MYSFLHQLIHNLIMVSGNDVKRNRNCANGLPSVAGQLAPAASRASAICPANARSAARWR